MFDIFLIFFKFVNIFKMCLIFFSDPFCACEAIVKLSFEQIHKLKLALIYKPFHWHFYIHTWNVDIVKAQQSLFWYKTANHKTKLKLNLVVYIFVPFWDIRHAKFKAKQFLFQTEQKSKHVNALNWSFVHIVLWGDETAIH